MTAVHLVGLALPNFQPTIENATIIDFTGRDAVTDSLTDLLRKGARELVQAAVEAEKETDCRHISGGAIHATTPHRIMDKAEAAYARSDLFDKRRDVLHAWTHKATPNQAHANIVALV